MKITPVFGNGLKFGIMYFFKAIDISMETINQKTKNW